jgi:hypothetical protein
MKKPVLLLLFFAACGVPDTDTKPLPQFQPEAAPVYVESCHYNGACTDLSSLANSSLEITCSGALTQVKCPGGGVGTCKYSNKLLSLVTYFSWPDYSTESAREECNKIEGTFSAGTEPAHCRGTATCDLTSTCIGTAAACSSYTGDACTYAGCESSTSCTGIVQGCSTIPGQFSCEAQAGCAWDDVTGTCGGAAQACDQITNYATCATQSGCSHTSVCSGTPRACSEAGLSTTCAQRFGCNWVTPTCKSCDAQSNETACTGIAGCDWH